MVVAFSSRRMIALCGLMAVLVSSLEGLADRDVPDGPSAVLSSSGPVSPASDAVEDCACLCRCACSGTANAVVIIPGTPIRAGFSFRSPFSVPPALRGIAAPSPEGPPPRT
jgi:hypothetical protein